MVSTDEAMLVFSENEWWHALPLVYRVILSVGGKQQLLSFIIFPCLSLWY